MILDPNNENVDNLHAVVVESNLRICYPPSTWNKFVSIKILLIFIILKEFNRISLKIMNAYLISQPNSPRFRLRLVRSLASQFQ